MEMHPKKWEKLLSPYRKKNPYNGWANYETWNVPLWVTNDEGSYNRLLFWKKGKHLSPEQVRDFVEDLYPSGTPDFDGDKSRYDLVDWQEVADSFNEIRNTERRENTGTLFSAFPEWSFTFEALPDDVEDRPGFNFLHAADVPPVTFGFEPTYKHIAAWLTRNGIKVSPKNVSNKDAIDQLGFFAESDDGKWFINVDPGEDNPRLTDADRRRLFPRPKRKKNPLGPVFQQGQVEDQNKVIRYDVYGAGPHNAGDEYPEIWAPPPPLGAAWDSEEWQNFEVELLRVMREAGIPARPTSPNDPVSGTAHVPAPEYGNDFLSWEHDGDEEFHLFYNPGDLK
jgi:hypothetical protein